MKGDNCTNIKNVKYYILTQLFAPLTLTYMWQGTCWKYATTPLQPSSRSAIWHTINGSLITHTQKTLASFIYLITLFGTQLQAEVHKFSRNLGITSHVLMPEELQETSSILMTYIH